MKNKKYLLFECLLDIPTNLVATKVVHSLKSAYPDRNIVVVTLFPEIWLHNPDVYRVYKIGAFEYFYEDYIKSLDTIICRHNPTLTTEYVKNEKPLEEIWCDIYKIPVKTNTPRLFFTWREKEAVQKLTKSDKPLFFIESESIAHGFGHAQFGQNQATWAEKVPPILLKNIVETLAQKSFAVVDISETANIPGLSKLNLNLRLKLCAIQYCDTLLAINSYSAHAAAAHGKKSVTLWVNESPVVWGYSSQKNITPQGDSDKIKFLESNRKDFSFSNIPNCPFDLHSLYNAKAICNELISISTHSNKK